MVGLNVQKSLLVAMVLGVVLLAWPVCAGAGGVPQMNGFAIPGPAAAEGSVQALALTPGALVGNYGLERPVITGVGDQHFPSIYGDYIVYEDLNPDANIKLHNRRTNAVTVVAGLAGSRQWRPRIWGNRIVWMDDRNGNWDIYWYDIAKKKEYRLTTDLADQCWPEISGNRVVWEDFRHGTCEVYMYDFATAKTTRVTADAHVQYSPRISGDRIIWQDRRNGNWDIYWYDIAKKKEYRLTSDPLDEYHPDIWGTRAAWTVQTGTHEDIGTAAYFDATHKAVLTYSAGGNQSRPRFYGDTITWVDDFTGTDEVFMYRFGAAGAGMYVTNSPGAATEPQLWGDTWTWFDSRNGNHDIYAAAVPSPKLTITAPTYVAYGGAATVKGALRSWDGAPLAGRPIHVQYLLYSNRGSFFWNNVNATTSSTGAFSAKLPVMASRFWVRAAFDGDPDSFRQVSSQKTVLPKVSLARPSGPKSISKSKTFTAAGNLRPRHTAGTKPVRIQCYRKESGRWKLRKTYYAKVSDYSTYSKYSVSAKLPYAGSWRIRAYYPKSTTNYKTYSSYRYITSK